MSHINWWAMRHTQLNIWPVKFHSLIWTRTWEQRWDKNQKSLCSGTKKGGKQNSLKRVNQNIPPYTATLHWHDSINIKSMATGSAIIIYTSSCSCSKARYSLWMNNKKASYYCFLTTDFYVNRILLWTFFVNHNTDFLWKGSQNAE